MIFEISRCTAFAFVHVFAFAFLCAYFICHFHRPPSMSMAMHRAIIEQNTDAAYVFASFEWMIQRKSEAHTHTWQVKKCALYPSHTGHFKCSILNAFRQTFSLQIPHLGIKYKVINTRATQQQRPVGQHWAPPPTTTNVISANNRFGFAQWSKIRFRFCRNNCIMQWTFLHGWTFCFIFFSSSVFVYLCGRQSILSYLCAEINGG